MKQVAQDDLFGGEPTVVEERPHEHPGAHKVVWLTGVDFVDSTMGRFDKDRALTLLGVPRAEGQNHLAAWRDEMARRTGKSTADFRQWLDWEVNIYGNKSLALFIWALA